MITWPPDLVGDIARRRCVVFIGSGVSRHSSSPHGDRPRSWEDFLTVAKSRISSKPVVGALINKGDYLTACQIVRDELGNQGFTDLMKESFQTPGFKPAPIHEAIYRLDSRIVLTPNFDKIYELHAQRESNGTVTTKSFTDDDIAYHVRRADPIVIKLHGTIDKPNSIIFSREDYIEARSKYRDFYAIIESLIVTHTFLFLGCGLNDPDIQLLLEDYAKRFRYSSAHYFTIPYRSVRRPVLKVHEKALNLRFIPYDSKDNHRLLAEGLNELVDLVESERAAIASTMKW